eukprot:3905147-Pyramimonas_sp.AAC.1
MLKLPKETSLGGSWAVLVSWAVLELSWNDCWEVWAKLSQTRRFVNSTVAGSLGHTATGQKIY